MESGVCFKAPGKHPEWWDVAVVAQIGEAVGLWIINQKIEV